MALQIARICKFRVNFSFYKPNWMKYCLYLWKDFLFKTEKTDPLKGNPEHRKIPKRKKNVKILNTMVRFTETL